MFRINFKERERGRIRGTYPELILTIQWLSTFVFEKLKIKIKILMWMSI